MLGYEIKSNPHSYMLDILYKQGCPGKLSASGKVCSVLSIFIFIQYKSIYFYLIYYLLCIFVFIAASAYTTTPLGYFRR